MIRERLLALREDRALLVSRAEHQRTALQELVGRAERVTVWFDRGRELLGRLRAHPLWIAGALALLVALRPRKALNWFATGVYVWRSWKSLRATLARLDADSPARGA